jgi:hypothetical protein
MIAFFLLFGLFAIAAAPSVAPQELALAVTEAAEPDPTAQPVSDMPTQPVSANYARGTGVIAIPLPPADALGRTAVMDPLPPYAIIGKGAGLILDRAPPPRPANRPIAR